jgi:hypothetical protein
MIFLKVSKRALAHGGPLRKPWIIFAFPISEISKKNCGASWAPRATFKLITMGGNFFLLILGGIFFCQKVNF